MPKTREDFVRASVPCTLLGIKGSAVSVATTGRCVRLDQASQRAILFADDDKSYVAPLCPANGTMMPECIELKSGASE